MAKEVSKEEFNKLLESDKTILADFSATWCGPCQMMAPILDELNEDMKSNKEVEIIKIDIDQNPDIAASYNVLGVPTFLVLKDGKEKFRQVGATTKENLKEKIEAELK